MKLLWYLEKNNIQIPVEDELLLYEAYFNGGDYEWMKSLGPVALKIRTLIA